jgi:hypothetical protein
VQRDACGVDDLLIRHGLRGGPLPWGATWRLND